MVARVFTGLAAVILVAAAACVTARWGLAPLRARDVAQVPRTGAC
jgi:hypothetical protein